MKIKKAIFPTAGDGTRLYPMTKTFPKELLPLIDKPLLQYALEEALCSGIEEFIFIIRKEKNPIHEYIQQFSGFSEFMSQNRIHYVYQEKPLGLGHAIYCTRHLINDEFFAILLPDEFILAQTPCLQQMLEVHKAVHSNVLAIHSVLHKDVSQYGIIKGEITSIPSVLKLKEMVEKPSPERAPSSLAIAGRYLLSSHVFLYLANQRAGANGEIQLTDSLHSLLNDESFYGVEFEGLRFDCGSKKGYLSAILKLSSDRHEVKNEIKQVVKVEEYEKALPLEGGSS